MSSTLSVSLVLMVDIDRFRIVLVYTHRQVGGAAVAVCCRVLVSGIRKKHLCPHFRAHLPEQKSDTQVIIQDPFP